MPELTEQHKAALEAGRSEGRKVKAYLEAIAVPKRKGRRRTADSITKRLAVIESELGSASVMKQLQLLQEQADLTSELESIGSAGVDMDALEADFVAVAESYGSRKGIEHATWRRMGVPAGVLSRAGIRR